jgi:sec-independent protein translocase protein TatB
VFDIGFSELMVIGIVALIVIGPERLPKVARTMGHLFGRMQRYVNDVKADISREMELDELKKLQSSLQDTARSFEQSVKSEVNAAETGLQKIAQEAHPGPDTPAAEPAPELTPELAPPPTGEPSAETSTQPESPALQSPPDKRVS